MSDLMQQRLEKVEQLQADGVAPYAYSYRATHKSDELRDAFESLPPGQEDEAADVAVCGRIMTRRMFGKLAFFTVQDSAGTVQLYLEKKRLGDTFKSFLALTDGGDFVGARGSVKRTDKGELSVYAREVTMLTKALRPLPDKWSGFTDVNKRYRQRYLDMVSNPSVRKTFQMRARMPRTPQSGVRPDLPEIKPALTRSDRRASSQDAPKGGKPTARPSQRRPPKAPLNCSSKSSCVMPASAAASATESSSAAVAPSMAVRSLAAGTAPATRFHTSEGTEKGR